MNKFTFLLFLFILIVSPMVLAPVPSTIVNTFEEGLTLDYKSFPTAKVNEGFSLKVHVYNLSNGLLISAPLASCEGHLFSPNGSIIEEQIATFEETYFNFVSDNYNITSDGFYTYSVHCNTSYLGGYSSDGFYATYSGLEQPTDFTKVFFIVTFMALVTFLIITLFNIIGHFVKLDVNVFDVAYSFCLFLGVITFNHFNMLYFGSKLIEDVTELFIYTGAITHIVLPLTAYIVSIIFGGMKKIKRIDQRTRASQNA